MGGVGNALRETSEQGRDVKSQLTFILRSISLSSVASRRDDKPYHLANLPTRALDGGGALLRARAFEFVRPSILQLTLLGLRVEIDDSGKSATFVAAGQFARDWNFS